MTRKAKITPERLAQIARRKLTALGVDTRLSADGCDLRGTWQLPSGLMLEHPMRQETLDSLSFRVVGHDRLVPVEPTWMADLQPQPFYDHQDMRTVVEQLKLRLRQRSEAVRQLQRRLLAMGLDSRLDEDRLQVLARIELPAQGRLELRGDERGLWVSGFDSALASMPSGRFTDWPVDMGAYEDKADLEMALGQALPRKLEAAQAAREAAKAPVKPVAQVQGLLSLEELYRGFGPQALLAPGVVLRKDLQVGDRKVRFLARHVQGGGFEGRLETEKGQAWSGSFDLASVVSVEDFVAGLLGQATIRSSTAPLATVSADPTAATSASVQGEEARLDLGQPLPVPGEVWVMTTLVEGDDGKEIRYVGVDQDGAPFGAPRVLPREAFLSVFTQVSHGVYRLRVHVQAVVGGQVTYLQVDSEGKHAAEPRRTSAAAFVSSFVPEAAGF